MAKVYGVGIMGAGNISAAYLRLAPLFKNLEVRAVADILPAAAEQRAAEYNVRAQTPDELLKNSELDVIVNLTIPATHYAVTSAILNAVVAEDLPGPGTVFLHVDWRFTAPVRPGDTITGRVEVLEVRTDKPITTLATRVTRQDGVVALEGKAVCYTMRLHD